MSFVKTAKNIIFYLENSAISIVGYMIAFIVAITLRNFFEMFSDNEAIYLPPILHYYLAYICFAVLLIILFHFATKETTPKIARVILPSFVIIIIGPVLDLIISSGKGYDISYMFQEVHGNLALRFVTFFGSFDKHGVTPGIRIEVALVLFLSCIYLWIKTGNLIRSLLFAFLIYLLIFLFFLMPLFTKLFFKLVGLNYVYSDVVMRNFYLLIFLIVGTWLFFLSNRAYFVEIVKDIRFLRILHFILMFVLGYVFAGRQLLLTKDNIWTWFFISASVVFACIFSLMTNNMADYDIDKISNKNRPLITQRIPQKSYTKISFIFLFLAVVYAAAVNFTSLFMVILFIGNYFLYSMPPFRLKRILLFSKAMIAFNSLVLFMLGYYLAAGNLNVPYGVVIFFLGCFTFALNFIDIKDYEGDKHAGIKTLPVALGLARSKLVIGFCFVQAYSLVCFLLGDIKVLLPALLTSLAQFSLINRRQYQETPVFVVYLFSVVALIVYLL